MRTALAWTLFLTGKFLWTLSERVQGKGPGPWSEPFHEVEGQFIWAEFERD